MQITTLQLWAADVQALAAFYARLLPGAAEVASDNTLRLRVGADQLIFKQAAEGWQGLYHYALRVAPERLQAAKAHVEAITPLARDGAGNDLFFSQNWGSNGFYWYDPAGNIAEIIAHGEAPPDAAPFESADIGGIAEAGAASDDPPALAEQLRRELGIDTYRDASDSFISLGDAAARLIVVRTGRIWFPNTGIAAAPVPATFQLTNDKGATFRVRCTTSGVTVAKV